MNSTTITVIRGGTSSDAAQEAAERDAREIAEKLDGAVGIQEIHLASPVHLFSALAGPEYEATLTFELLRTTDLTTADPRHAPDDHTG